MIDEREVEAARRAILSGWVTQGPEVAAFEREFAAAVGAPHACAVSSCTTALHLALVALGRRARRRSRHRQPFVHRHGQRHPLLRRDAGVRGHRARHLQHRLHALVEAAIRPRTKAILAVHQLGMPCDLGAILAPGAATVACRSIEDAACAIGSEIRWHGEWQRIGRPHGDVACFSFHPRKLLSTGDGGMLTTADAGPRRSGSACCGSTA